MDETKMDLDAIDELAWHKIIKFLDSKSRLHCRLLSRTIHGYVYYVGLNLRVTDLNVLKNRNKEAWENFLNSPEVYFTKVHIKAHQLGNEFVSLGLTAQHQVEELKVSGFLSLESIVNFEWTQNLVKLSLHGTALATRFFAPTVAEAKIGILLPCLKILFMTASWNVEVERQNDTKSCILFNISILLMEMGSKKMEQIYVDIRGTPNIVLLNFYRPLHLRALAKCIQANKKTLQTLIWHLGSTDPEPVGFGQLVHDAQNVEFTSTLEALKQVDTDFICFSASSPLLKLVEGSNQLEELIEARCDETFPQVLLDYQNIITNLCQKNFRTLKYIQLFVPITEDRPLDLGIFGSCHILEHLHLSCIADSVSMFFTNLPMLPSSLKVFVIHRNRNWDWDPENIVNTLNMDEIPRLRQFKNLVEFQICECLLLSSEELVQLTKVLVRLPKLNFLQMNCIGLTEYSAQCQDLLEALSEGQCKNQRKLDTDFFGVSLEGKLGRDAEAEKLSLAEFETLHYQTFHGPVCQREKNLNKMDESGNPRNSCILPKVGDTRFRLHC